MITKIDKDSFVVFDLDDTLFNEVDFLKSGYKFIANKLAEGAKAKKLASRMFDLFQTNQNPFKYLLGAYSSQNLEMPMLIEWYRYHKPGIKLKSDAILLLELLKNSNVRMGIITDGRSRTQRNKIGALGLTNYLADLVISEEFGSEKPSIENYLHFVDNFGRRKYIYIGDNYNKDFISPNQLGWLTIGLRDQGLNIHKQDVNLPKRYLPKIQINSLKEIIL
jgi:putative hydrolase of the HAD superfamily